MKLPRIGKIAIGLGIAAGLAVGVKAIRESLSPGGEAINYERRAPAFELRDAKGKLHRLNDWKGEVVLVHFWASWCAPCLSEIPKIIELARRLEKMKVKVVAVSLDDQWVEAEKILKSSELPPQLISLLDESKTLPDEFGTYQYPETYLLNKEHKVVFKWVGPQDWTSEPIFQLLTRLVGP